MTTVETPKVISHRPNAEFARSSCFHVSASVDGSTEHFIVFAVDLDTAKRAVVQFTKRSVAPLILAAMAAKEIPQTGVTWLGEEYTWPIEGH